MYMTIRKYRDMRSVPEAARRAEAELAPVLRRTPGFRGYYILDCGDSATASVTLFEGREGALAANERALAWVFEALADRHVGDPPEVTTGEVLVAVVAGGEDSSPVPAAVPARSEATARRVPVAALLLGALAGGVAVALPLLAAFAKSDAEPSP